MALYLSERLTCNSYYTLDKLIFSVIYILSSALFLSIRRKFVKCSHERKEDSFSDIQIFHIDESSKSSQRILLAFGLLLFFHRTSFTK